MVLSVFGFRVALHISSYPARWSRLDALVTYFASPNTSKASAGCGCSSHLDRP